ncbi:hypothetical protein OIDMADRAFT_185064 [Oidiodendron maius Zn]|uniref:Uncharacterized protein n=1 Tax=Oidiodendron maius (strain Zn) TaxID=913774 RepID=A0A0C3CSP6_OIDMZ|nr:hypothetical protein OIDMADRAFT_185064 [Oidiodendron maius Zn]
MVIAVIDDLPDDVHSAKGNVDEMYRRFRDWNPTLRSLLRMIKETSIWTLQNISRWNRGHTRAANSNSLEMPAMLCSQGPRGSSGSGGWRSDRRALRESRE